MKNFFAISFALSLFLLGCNKEEQTAQTTSATQVPAVTNPEKFEVDSVKINDSLKIDENLTAGFKAKLLVFPQIKDSVLLDSIYAREKINVDTYTKTSLLQQLQANKTKFYEDTKQSLKDWKPDFKQKWTENSDMKMFSHTNDLLTIKYSGDGFTGGAHGYYYEFYKVFDLRTNKTLQLSDVISEKDPKIWSRILMDNFLSNDLEKGQSKMLLVKEIPLTDNFYFDEDNLYFLYNQYEITAYAAGPVLIKIPFSAVRPLLKSDFKTRAGL